MKKLILKLVMILFTISGLMNHLLAQVPEGIIYQAEARDGKNLIPNQALDVKIAIIQDVPTGTVVFEESHKVTTNDFGMFVLVIGQGSNTLGLLLENVDWGNHYNFLNVQVKKTKATVWINMGTSQLLSVPYALHAKTATEAFTADYNYLYNVPTNVSHFNNDADYITNADNIVSLANKVDKVAGKDLFPNGTTPGQMNYWNGSEWITVTPGLNGQALTFCNGKPTWGPCPNNVVEVTSLTGEIWMDRNLGASQVATGSADEAAYGDLYQWGRATDGHEKRNSATTSVLSSSDTPCHPSFIMAPNSTVLLDWRSPQNTNLWQGINGVNNPCPGGFRIPTEAELIDEMVSWSSQNTVGAFESPIKLSAGGYRSHADASLNDYGMYGFYWSSTVEGNNSRNIVIRDDGSYMYSHPRAYGFSVRCIKD